jgi:hypothetical protein
VCVVCVQSISVHIFKSVVIAIQYALYLLLEPLLPIPLQKGHVDNKRQINIAFKVSETDFSFETTLTDTVPKGTRR